MHHRNVICVLVPTWDASAKPESETWQFQARLAAYGKKTREEWTGVVGDEGSGGLIVDERRAARLRVEWTPDREEGTSYGGVQLDFRALPLRKAQAI